VRPAGPVGPPNPPLARNCNRGWFRHNSHWPKAAGKADGMRVAAQTPRITAVPAAIFTRKPGDFGIQEIPGTRLTGPWNFPVFSGFVD
jgi:hypothetical protein